MVEAELNYNSSDGTMCTATHRHTHNQKLSKGIKRIGESPIAEDATQSTLPSSVKAWQASPSKSEAFAGGFKSKE